MAYQKNVVRKHAVMPFDPEKPELPKAEDEGWLPLAKAIETIEDDSDEDTDDHAFYDGDGTSQTVLNSRSEVWNFSGYYDPSDPAQKLIASLRRNISDEGRYIWHKIVETNGDTVIGLAKAMEIKAGGGDANEYEDFEGHLDFIKTPTVAPKA